MNKYFLYEFSHSPYSNTTGMKEPSFASDSSVDRRTAEASLLSGDDYVIL